jgi:hypothetical protein
VIDIAGRSVSTFSNILLHGKKTRNEGFFRRTSSEQSWGDL